MEECVSVASLSNMPTTTAASSPGCLSDEQAPQMTRICALSATTAILQTTSATDLPTKSAMALQTTRSAPDLHTTSPTDLHTTSATYLHSIPATDSHTTSAMDLHTNTVKLSTQMGPGSSSPQLSPAFTATLQLQCVSHPSTGWHQTRSTVATSTVASTLTTSATTDKLPTGSHVSATLKTSSADIPLTSSETETVPQLIPIASLRNRVSATSLAMASKTRVAVSTYAIGFQTAVASDRDTSTPTTPERCTTGLIASSATLTTARTTLDSDLPSTTATSPDITGRLAAFTPPPSDTPPVKSGFPFHPGKLNRHQLPLDMKIEAIRLHEEQGLSGRSIVEVMNMHGFKCGKTQVQNILKRKYEWIEQYAQNAPLDRKRKMRRTGNEEVNILLYKWFEKALDEGLPVNGPMLQEKAREMAREMGLHEFKASNGWLEAFRKRHSISFGKPKSAALDFQAGLVHGHGLVPERRLPILDNQIQDFTQPDALGKGDMRSKADATTPMIVGDFVREQAASHSAHLQQSTSRRQDTDEEEENLQQLESKHNPEDLHRCSYAVVEMDGEGSEKQAGRRSGQDEEEDVVGDPRKEEKQLSQHPKFRSLEDIAAILQEMRHFFATKSLSHLLDTCLDLEEQVALECVSRQKLQERSTILDHLNPLDTRPVYMAETLEER